jgi:hypothetical protein
LVTVARTIGAGSVPSAGSRRNGCAFKSALSLSGLQGTSCQNWPNCRFNSDADTSHRSGYALWAPVNLALGFSQMLGYSKSFALPMIKSFSLALALAYVLIASPDAVAAQVFKCNVNGSIHYQQSPCQSNEARKPPTVEELNAERQRQLAQEKERPTSPKLQARPAATSEPLEEAPAKVLPSAPRSSFKCDGRKYCSQMTSCAEAKYFLSTCPSVKMDGDGDGIPCEEQLCGH